MFALPHHFGDVIHLNDPYHPSGCGIVAAIVASPKNRRPGRARAFLRRIRFNGVQQFRTMA
jgi:hypothetical protein